MDDENSEEFVARLTVEESPNNKSTINRFRRKMFNIPDERKIRWSVDDRDFNKTIRQSLKNLEHFRKINTTRLNPATWFRGHNYTQQINAIYDRAATSMMSSLDTMQKAINAFDADEGPRSLAAAARKSAEAVNLYNAENEKLSNITDNLKAAQEELKNLKLIPDLDKLREQREGLSKELSKLKKEYDDFIQIGSEQDVQKQEEILLKSGKNFRKAAEQALLYSKENKGVKDKKGNYVASNLKNKLEEDVTNRKNNATLGIQRKDALIDLNTKAIEDAQVEADKAKQIRDSLKPGTEEYLVADKQYQDALAKIKKLQSEITNLTKEKRVIELELKIANKDERNLQEVWSNKFNPEEYSTYDTPKGKTHAQAFNSYFRSSQEDEMNLRKSNRDVKSYYDSLQSPSDSAELEKRMGQKQAQIAKIDEQMQNPGNSEANKARIKEVEATISALEKEERAQVSALKKAADASADAKKHEEMLNDEYNTTIKRINQIRDDSSKDPMHTKWTYEGFKGLNNYINRTMVSLKKYGGIMQRLGKRLQSTFVGKVIKRIGVNIKSQIADLINPLTNARKAWSSWLDRWENMDWKNTFDMVKYNLVSAIAPALEKIAMLLLKCAAIANIFTKKYAGIDLFDKSAWELEKMRKGVGQLTADFDELHSSNDNPNEFNTVFDTGRVNKDDLLTDEEIAKWTSRFEKLKSAWDSFSSAVKSVWGVLKKVFGWLADAILWCIKHWKILAGLLVAFKLGKGLLDLFGGFSGLLNTLKKIKGFSGLSFGGLLNGAAWASAIAGSLLDAYHTWKMMNKWGGMTPQERQEEGDKGIKAASMGWGGFGALKGIKQGMEFAKSGAMSGNALVDGLALGALYAEVTSGLAKAISAGVKTGFALWKGDTATMKHFATEVGEGVGQAGGAVAGALMGAKIGGILGGPLGASIGLGLGAIVGGFAGSKAGQKLGEALGNELGKISDWFFGTGTFQKMHASLNDVKEAEKRATDAVGEYYSALDDLNELEKEYGISGKEVYDAIEQGKIKMTELTPEQYKVYQAYLKMKDAQDEMKTSLKNQLEVDAKWEEQQAKKSGNFKTYIQTLQDGVAQGIISQDEMLDHFAQTYASLDNEHKKIFLSQLPLNMRQSVISQSEEYISGWSKFKQGMKNVFDNLGAIAANAATGVALGFAVGGPVGAAIGGIIGLVKSLTTAFNKAKGELSELGNTAEDEAEAFDILTDAQDRQKQLTEKLDKLQRDNRVSVVDLVTALDDGRIKYEDLTDSQRDMLRVQSELERANDDATAAANRHAKIQDNVRWETTKTSGNYKEYIDALREGARKGVISQEEMNDMLAQRYAELSGKARETFEEYLPKVSKAGIIKQSIEYMGVWDGFKTKITEGWTKLVDKAKIFFNKIRGKETADDFNSGIDESTKAYSTELEKEYADLMDSIDENSFSYENGEKAASVYGEGLINASKYTSDELKDNWRSHIGETNKIFSEDDQQGVSDWTKNLESKVDNTKYYTEEEVNQMLADTSDKFNYADTDKSVDDWTTRMVGAQQKNYNAMNTETANMIANSENALRNSNSGVAANEWTAKMLAVINAQMVQLQHTMQNLVQASNATMQSAPTTGAHTWMENLSKTIGAGLEGIKRSMQSLSDWWNGLSFGNKSVNISTNGIKGLPSYDVGTNYVPNDGLAYIHQGEAIVPAKYNKPYNPNEGSSQELINSISNLTYQVGQIQDLVNRGIPVKGEFTQRGSDLVATVERAKSQNGNQPLSNPVFAR